MGWLRVYLGAYFLPAAAGAILLAAAGSLWWVHSKGRAAGRRAGQLEAYEHGRAFEREQSARQLREIAAEKASLESERADLDSLKRANTRAIDELRRLREQLIKATVGIEAAGRAERDRLAAVPDDLLDAAVRERLRLLRAVEPQSGGAPGDPGPPR